MVGIVIVSHSAALAEGVVELAREMAGPDVKLVPAGGLDLPGRPLGTDPARVAEAIRGADQGDGVAVLMDLGSALLSAEMALELLPPDLRGRVALSGAPLVEGALAAAVQARLGATLAQVLEEAGGALGAKAAHLQPVPAEPRPVQAPPPEEGARSFQWTVRNLHGLHARPAARLVQAAARFPDARLQLRNLSTGRGPAPAGSINAVAMLGLVQGQTLAVEAWGPQAGPALAALRALAETDFGEEPGGPLPAPTPEPPANAAPVRPGTGLAGLAAAPGLALGPVRHLRAEPVPVPGHPAADPGAEWSRLDRALDQVRAQIRADLAGVADRAGREVADLFEAHLLFLDDPALLEPARRLVLEERCNAAAAWQRASEAMARDYRSLGDAYLRDRADDILAVAGQVVAQLEGGARPALGLAEPGILVAQDLTPADTARLDPARVQAICTAAGAPTSHSAILARALGIPAVVGLGPALLDIPEGTTLLVDAEAGRVVPEPADDLRASLLARREALRAEAAEALAASAAPAVTRDGRRVEIGANLASVAEARAAVAAGAEGVGLLRTEFLFTGRASAPEEEEQYQALCALGEALDGRPMVVRTLDAGGDKELPFLDTARDANPFLGWRAIRIGLDRPELLKAQLRAIARAAARHPLKVMFPMIATVSELRAAKALLAEAMAEARAAGHPVPGRLETGIMVEVPAAALRASQLALEADFFSIGTNDLTQYTLAAERGNPRVAALADAFHPAVLELVRQVVEAAHARGRWVGLCGELGGDLRAIPLLVGLGIDELSMAAPGIPAAKRLVRGLEYEFLRQAAPRILDRETPEQVRADLGDLNAAIGKTH